MVSVVVPIYNVEKYIRECIDSVLNQTYKDLEIILVDDGSPDNCGKICDAYAKQDVRIKVIHKKNGGLSDARNAGMDIASGEYIYFLDSDDYIKTDAIEQLVHCIEKEKADIVYFEAETIFEDFEKPDYYEVFIRSNSYKTAAGAAVHLSHLRHAEYFSGVVLLFMRREFLKEHQLRFYKGIIHEDELFTPVAFIKAKRVASLKKALYARRLRANSIMSRNYSLKSLEGDSICVREYGRMFNNYPAGSIERKILRFHLLDKAGAVLNVYCFMEEDHRLAKPALQRTIIAMDKFGFFNNRKLMIKLHFAGVYRLYARHIRDKKDWIIQKINNLRAKR